MGAGELYEEADDGNGEPEDKDEGESMPPFLLYGIFTVVVYGVVVTVLVAFTSVGVEGPTLVAFTVGFLVFMTVYFVSMWAGWLFFDGSAGPR